MLEASDRSENRAGALVLVNPHVPQSGVGGLRRLDGKYDRELGGAGVRGDRVDEVLGVVHLMMMMMMMMVVMMMMMMMMMRCWPLFTPQIGGTALPPVTRKNSSAHSP